MVRSWYLHQELHKTAMAFQYPHFSLPPHPVVSAGILRPSDPVSSFPGAFCCVAWTAAVELLVFPQDDHEHELIFFEAARLIVLAINLTAIRITEISISRRTRSPNFLSLDHAYYTSFIVSIQKCTFCTITYNHKLTPTLLLQIYFFFPEASIFADADAFRSSSSVVTISKGLTSTSLRYEC